MLYVLGLLLQVVDWFRGHSWMTESDKVNQIVARNCASSALVRLNDRNATSTYSGLVLPSR